MDDGWIIDRRIICVNDDGETVTVFRILISKHIFGQKRHKYVLGNGDRVLVVSDSKFRIAGTNVVLQPVRVYH